MDWVETNRIGGFASFTAPEWTRGVTRPAYGCAESWHRSHAVSIRARRGADDCIAQAWSVAELLRCAAEDLLLKEKEPLAAAAA